MRFLLSIIAITFCAVTADAQTFLGNLRQNEQGKGKVTVQQSADIDALVNGASQQQKQAATPQSKPQQQATPKQTTVKEPVHTQLVAPPTKTKTQDASPKEHTTATKPQAEKPVTKEQEEKPVAKEHEEAPVQRERVTPSKEEEETTTIVDTRKKVMSRSYKTQGYRIQVFSGGNSRKDRQKAETAGTTMKAYFPSEPVYVHFYSPSWKCRMGNYKSVSEARSILAKVKKLGYPQACIVKGPISVQY